MELIWQELTFGIPDGHAMGIIAIRLTAAVILGALIGIERQSAGKSAGLRTHMLVTVASALFLLACSRYGIGNDGMSRVIQGIATGIGFIGAGTIIKLEGTHDVKGLTTSAGIWMAAAIGITVGLGAVGLAVIATVLALIILNVTTRLDHWINKRYPRRISTRVDNNVG